VAREFTEAHRAALDWLNSITADDFEFYGLEIEAWRIGTSPPAPKFNMVVRPNDWSKQAKKISDGPVSDLKLQQQAYWEALRTLLLERKSKVKPQKPSPQHWTNFSLGRSGVWMAAGIHSQKKQVWVDVSIRGPAGKVWYDELVALKDVIEMEFGEALSWHRLDTKKMSRIALYRDDSDIAAKYAWPIQQQWLIQKLECFDHVFRPRIKLLPDGDDSTEGNDAGLEHEAEGYELP